MVNTRVRKPLFINKITASHYEITHKLVTGVNRTARKPLLQSSNNKPGLRMLYVGEEKMQIPFPQSPPSLPCVIVGYSFCFVFTGLWTLPPQLRRPTDLVIA